MTEHEFKDITEFFSAVCQAVDEGGGPVVQKNHEGKTHIFLLKTKSFTPVYPMLFIRPTSDKAAIQKLLKAPPAKGIGAQKAKPQAGASAAKPDLKPPATLLERVPMGRLGARLGAYWPALGAGRNPTASSR